MIASYQGPSQLRLKVLDSIVSNPFDNGQTSESEGQILDNGDRPLN
ncbi:MAG: hypothetical protein LBQ77_07350 [Treponema sp.]|nr:hypothetical protein [Treponema sp.]